MKYVYDIVLNFNMEYYDFYEWNKNDKLLNVKKIPLYRVSKDDYNSIKYNDVIIDKINDKMMLITNTLEVMAIIINKGGRVVKRSSLLIDEEDEILDGSDELKITKLEFKKNIYRKREIVGRSNKEKRQYVNLFFKNINLNNDLYLLKYIYYDLYRKDDDIDNIYNTLLNNCDINLLYEELKKIGV